jgi:hypothetical protein
VTRLLAGGAIVLLVASPGVAQHIDFHGQLSGWAAGGRAGSLDLQFGLRYIPTLSLTKSLTKKYALDAEISVNLYGVALGTGIDHLETAGRLRPYRMWLRFATSQFEARIGLQKISFGSALLLRPLMWFDRIDPNDPLQLTNGVYGLLLRYTFLNNANVWLWGLYGNDDLKGWETTPTLKKTPEYGGRLQFPLLKGELAFSYHHRRADPSRGLLPELSFEPRPVAENRFALDGKWDLGVGLWFEGTLTRQDLKFFPLKYQRALNLGLDYTFSVGDGLHILGEYLIMQLSETALGKGQDLKFSALSIDYPLGLTDRIKGVAFYSWESGDWYRFVTWQRILDRWGFYIIGFWNPESYRIIPSQQGKSAFVGKGLEVIVVFNH